MKMTTSMSPWLVRLVLLAVAVALFAWDRSLTREEVARRDTANRIGRLITKDLRDGLEIGGITLTNPVAGTFSYVLADDGLWRCSSYHDAVCDAELIEQLLKRLLEVEGVVQTRDRSLAHDHGFGRDTTWFLGIHQQSGEGERVPEPLFRVEIGSAADDPPRCYARLDQHPQIWELDADLRRFFELPEGFRFPPLLEYTVLPRAWMKTASRLDRILVRAPGSEYELLIRDKDVSEDQMRKGVPSYEWFLKQGDAESLCPTNVVSQFVAYLYKVPFSEVVDAEAVPRQGGVQESGAIISFIPEEGDPLEISIGASAGDGTGYVYCNFSGSLFKVRAELVNLMFPKPETLLTAAEETAWSRLLKN